MPARMPSTLTVRDLPVSERPRERLTRLGADALSDHELLACVLGRGVAGESVLVSAQRLLKTFDGLPGLAAASVEQLSRVHGIGPAKAAQLKAAVELAGRAAMAANGERPVVDSTETAAALLRPVLVEKSKEHVVALLLDNRHRLIRIAPIAVGSLSASLVHPRELFKEAIAASAAAVIVAHNHPSGDPAPSEHDLALTKRLTQAGALLGIEVLDHLIIARQGCVSLRAITERSPDRRRAPARSHRQEGA